MIYSDTVQEFKRFEQQQSCHKCKQQFRYYYMCKAISDGQPASEKDWEVVVTHTIPGSGIKRVFRRSDLTTDYSEF